MVFFPIVNSPSTRSPSQARAREDGELQQRVQGHQGDDRVRDEDHRGLHQQHGPRRAAGGQAQVSQCKSKLRKICVNNASNILVCRLLRFCNGLRPVKSQN